MNKKLLHFISTIPLVAAIAFFLYSYQLTKKENLALKLKRDINVKKKKKPLSWPLLYAEENSILSEKEKSLVEPLAENNGIKKIAEKSDEVIQEIDTERLYKKVHSNLKNFSRLNENEIQESIKLVDELISRNPDVYSNYKGKLILLLTQEGAHQASISNEEVSSLLETMSGFDVSSDKSLRKEAFLIAKTNNEIDELVDDVEILEEEVEEAQSEQEVVEIEKEIEEKLSQIDEMEKKVEEGLLSDDEYLNEDLVEIPFLRDLAGEKYDEVISSAESFLEEYPDSVNGYFYLIKGLELSGQQEEANEVLMNSGLDGRKLDELRRKLSSSQNKNPKDYWKSLRF